MRTIAFAAVLMLATPSWAQPALKVTQLAELADGLSQPHDAAFSPDGKLIYVTDMRNSRIRVLEAMTLSPSACSAKVNCPTRTMPNSTGRAAAGRRYGQRSASRYTKPRERRRNSLAS